MNKKKERGEKEVDSMNAMAMERNGYKRLNFGTLNFADRKEINEECIEDITPIHWAKEVLSGEKTVIIKKQ